MKTIKLSKGLQINKEVVSKLQESQMGGIKGGNASAEKSCGAFTTGSCSSIQENKLY